MTTCKNLVTGAAFLTPGTAGRKKRELISQEPVLKVSDKVVALKDYISKVQEHPEEPIETQALEDFQRHPRLVTVLTTSTVLANLTITATTTPLEVETLAFTTTDANHCLPADIIATMDPCI